MFDLLLVSEPLRRHVASREVAFGVNHEMVDFRNNRKKNLDLVICTPRDAGAGVTLSDLAAKYGVRLSSHEAALLAALPTMAAADVSMVRVALEAKACMTEHAKALPRLHDELNSSHLTIHGSSNDAIAVGFSMVNIAQRFLSSDRNKYDLSRSAPTVTVHRQPAAVERVIAKLKEIPRRTRPTEEGFEAFGIVVVELVNDGSRVSVHTAAPSPPAGDIFHYESMVARIADLYKSRHP